MFLLVFIELFTSMYLSSMLCKIFNALSLAFFLLTIPDSKEHKINVSPENTPKI